MPQIKLQTLDGAYAISRLDATEAIPAWADGGGFVSISRTDDELSVVCLADRVPGDVKSDGGWTCFKLVGPFAFNETGIALAVIKPLAEAGIGIFLVSTFDTDYLLVKSSDAANAQRLLADVGHTFVR